MNGVILRVGNIVSSSEGGHLHAVGVRSQSSPLEGIYIMR